MRRALCCLLVCCLLALPCACTTATIQRAGGPDLEAQLVGGDKQYLYVRTESGQTFRVPRNTVVDIDHPGNVLMVASTPVLLEAALFFVIPAALNGDCASRNCDEFNALFRGVGIVFGGAGLAMLAGGAIPWLRSTGAVATDAGMPEGMRGDVDAMAPAAKPAAGPGAMPPLAEPAAPK